MHPSYWKSPGLSRRTERRFALSFHRSSQGSVSLFLSRSGQDPPAHGGVQGEHAATMPDDGVAVLADDVIVVALGVEVGDDVGRLAGDEEPAGILPHPLALAQQVALEPPHDG